MSEFAVPERIRESAEARRRRRPPISNEGKPSEDDSAALQAFGARNIEQLNNKLRRLDDAHRNAVGYTASPGLAFDILRSPTRDKDYQDLFVSRATTGMQSRVASLVDLEGLRTYGGPGRTLTDVELSTAALVSQGGGELVSPFDLAPPANPTEMWNRWSLHGGATTGEIAELSEQSFDEMVSLGRRVFEEWVPNGFMYLWERSQPGEADPVAARLQTSGVTFGGVSERFWEQLGLGFAYAPAGGIMILEAGGKDIATAFTGGKPTNLATLGKQVAEFSVEAITNPFEYPGDALLLLFAAATGAVGAAGRVGAAGTAIAAGQGPRGAAGALLRRSPPGTVQIAGESLFLSENLLARAVQRRFYAAKQKRLDRYRHRLEADTPNKSHALNTPALIDWIVDETGQRALGKARRNAIRLEWQLANYRVAETLNVTRGSVKGRQIFEKLLEDPGYKSWYRNQDKLTQLGVQKAIQVVASDYDRVGWIKQIDLERKMHQSYLDDTARSAAVAERNGLTTEQVVNNHRAHLTALDEAEKVLMRTGAGVGEDTRFWQAFEATKRLADEAEMYRIGQFGLHPLVASDRVGRMGMKLRGQPLEALNAPEALIFAEIDRLNALVQDRRVAARGRQLRDERVIANREKAIRNRQKKIDDLKKKDALTEKQTERLAKMEQLQAKDRAKIGDKQEGLKVKAGEGETFVDRGASRPPGAVIAGGDDLTTSRLAEKVTRLERALDDPALVSNPVEMLQGLGFKKNEILAQFDQFGATPTNPDAFYFPAARAVFSEPAAPSSIITTTTPHGKPPPKTLNVSHRFTGEAIEIGDFRVDVTNLTTESYLRTVRTIQLRDEHQRLWALATDRPGDARYAIPIRDVSTIPDELRAISQRIDDGVMDELSASKFMTDDAIQNLSDTLFPGKYDFRNRRYRFDPDKVDGGEPALAALRAEGHVKWVDIRSMADSTPGGTKFWDRVDAIMSADPGRAGSRLEAAAARAATPLALFNEVVRDLTLFGRPAYALNALGAGSMSLIQQGPMAIPHLLNALTLRQRVGREIVHWVDELAGEPRTAAFVDTKIALTKPSRTLQRVWVAATDKMFRRSAVLFELQRRGVWRTDDLRAAANVTRKADNPELWAKIAEAERGANRAMVRFNNLNPFEQSVLRHVFFIYPWVSRSAKWSLDNLIDHPIKTTVAFEAGHVQEERLRRLFGEIPDLFARLGFYVDEEGDYSVRGSRYLAPFDAGMEIIRPFTTLATSGLGDVSRDSFASNFGGAGEFLQMLVTGRDEFGNPVADEGEGLLEAAARRVFEGTPAGALRRRGDQLNEPEQILAEPDVRDPESRITLENTARDLPWFRTDDKWDVYSPYLLGQATSRSVNPGRLNAEHWDEKTKQEQYDHDVALLNQGLKDQSELLGRPLPPAVQRWREWSLRWSKIASGLDENTRIVGPTATTRERVRAKVALLDELGWISDEAKTRALETVADAASDNVLLVALEKKLVMDAVDSEAARAWQKEVDAVGMFLVYDLGGGEKKDPFDTLLPLLPKVDLPSYGPASRLSEKGRTEYGRLLWEYTRATDEFRKFMEDPATGPQDRAEALLERRDDVIDFDEPVMIEGVTLPPIEELAWALMPEGDREARRLAIPGRDYRGLTRVEKKVFGRDVTTDIQRGWLLYDTSVEAHGSSLSEFQANALANEVERRHPGFKEDWDFSRLSTAERLRSANFFRDSRFKSEWETWFLRDATALAEMIQARREGRERGTIAAVREAWKGSKDTPGAAAERYTIIERDNLEFLEEVNLVGGKDFVVGLIDR